MAESFFGVSAMVQTLNEAQSSVGRVSFDSQLRYFSRELRPLCWMAMPDLHATCWPLKAAPDEMDLLELLGR